MNALKYNYSWAAGTVGPVRKTVRCEVGQTVKLDYFREAAGSKSYSGIVERVVNKETGDLLTVKTDAGYRSFHADLITFITLGE